MATTKQLRTKKAKKKKQRTHYPNGSHRWLKLSFAIGRLNKRLRRKAKLDAEQRLARRVLEEAIRCSKLGITYVWGGSHGSSPTPLNGPWDCSSYCSHLAQLVVPNVETMTTLSMMDFARAGKNGLEEGEGDHVTFHVKDDHVICEIRFRGKTYWTECGGSDNPTAGDGPCFFTPTASRLAQFTFKCHPAGL